MTRHLRPLLLAAFVASLAPAPRVAAGAPPPADIDAESEPIVRVLTDAMGGQTAWDRLPCVRFDFVVVRDGKEALRARHWWDRRRGRCRVEGTDDRGRHVTAIFDLADRKGTAFVEGIGESDSAQVAEVLAFGYERWVNDTYWLMMPFKLRDPGVRLRYARPERTPKGSYDVLELSFVPGTGLTPKDRYWLYVNKETHLIDRWEYLLTGRQPPPKAATWEAWSRVGPVLLPMQRRFEGSTSMLRFENVSMPQAFEETVFTYSSIRD